MRRFYKKRTPPKNFTLTVVNDNTLRVKSSKMSHKDLDVLKKACHVNDKRKTFDIAKVDWRTFMTFSDKFTIADVPMHVQRLMQRHPTELFDLQKVPQNLWSTLFPYQKEGVEEIFNRYSGRCLLADDMGLGKTRQALTFIGHCLPARVLVVCPSYLRYHWSHSLEEWLSLETQLVKKG